MILPCNTTVKFELIRTIAHLPDNSPEAPELLNSLLHVAVTVRSMIEYEVNRQRNLTETDATSGGTKSFDTIEDLRDDDNTGPHFDGKSGRGISWPPVNRWQRR